MNLDSSIIFSICVFLCLAIGLILFVILYQRRFINHQEQLKKIDEQKQQELIQASIKSEEDERMRIASELHDDVGATLSSIRLFLSKASQDPSDTSIIMQSKELLDDSIEKIRNLSHQLQPSTLQYLGLQKSLQSLAELISRSSNIQITYIFDDEWPKINPDTELSVYRIVQELINNIIKHSEASTIEIKACHKKELPCISLSHNGKGLTEASYQELLYKKDAIGLKNIEHRLKSSDSRIEFMEPKEGIYTLYLWLSLPINV